MEILSLVALQNDSNSSARSVSDLQFGRPFSSSDFTFLETPFLYQVDFSKDLADSLMEFTDERAAKIKHSPTKKAVKGKAIRSKFEA
ncbi:hypothetical protein SDJN03_03305, partial [Cucurbita argyrosperma subsp. sororia]